MNYYEILEVNESTLVRWVDKGCPKVSRGWYSIKDVLDWRNASFKAMTENDVDKMNVAERKTFYDSKVKEAQLEAITLKNKIAAGDYIAKDEIVDELNRFLVVLKRSMNTFSKKITTDLQRFVNDTEARRMEKTISDTVHQALLQLSISGVYDSKKTIKEDKKN